MSIPMSRLNIGDETYEVVDEEARQGKLNWDDIQNKPFDELAQYPIIFNRTFQLAQYYSYNEVLLYGYVIESMEDNLDYSITINGVEYDLEPQIYYDGLNDTTHALFRTLDVTLSFEFVKYPDGNGGYEYAFNFNNYEHTYTEVVFSLSFIPKTKLQPEYIDLDALSAELGIDGIEAELETLLSGNSLGGGSVA